MIGEVLIALHWIKILIPELKHELCTPQTPQSIAGTYPEPVQSSSCPHKILHTANTTVYRWAISWTSSVQFMSSQNTPHRKQHSLSLGHILSQFSPVHVLTKYFTPQTPQSIAGPYPEPVQSSSCPYKILHTANTTVYRWAISWASLVQFISSQNIPQQWVLILHLIVTLLQSSLMLSNTVWNKGYHRYGVNCCSIFSTSWLNMQTANCSTNSGNYLPNYTVSHPSSL